MHWRKRMMAIALAGGSVAACSSEIADPTDVTSTVPAGGLGSGWSAVPAPRGNSTVDRVLTATRFPGGGFVIPPCNANPDPCCRNPDLPQCPVPDAGSPDAGSEAAGDDAAGDDVSEAGVDVVDSGADDADAGSSCNGSGTSPF
jgi:hypothetical protein